MSLDFYLTEVQPCTVFQRNITHNLGGMANEAGIYQHLWRPGEIGVTHARQMIEPLRKALLEMEADPERFKKFDAPNGWGKYEHFLPFVREVLEGCEEHPDAEISVSR